MVQQMGLTNGAFQYQFVNDDCQDVLIYNEKHNTEGSSKDAWWFEALKVADDIEEKQRTFELSNMEKNDGDDDSWWTAVERTASQAELLQFG
uniref:Uncharacterized protein n=1 Tax=Rhizophora mucronata TaxID=61149 RepID=A0A2P2NWK1_RHIMU